MESRTDAPVCSALSTPGTTSTYPVTTSTSAVTAPTGRGRRVAVATIATAVGAAALVGVSAAPAQAQSFYTVWDRVASCESGGHWHINTDNGFYGGLQFSGGTWRSYHGQKYASRADRASRLQQIEVARRVLASQGPGAWPVCGPRAGLTRSSGHATHQALPAVAGQDAQPVAKHAATHKPAHPSTKKPARKPARKPAAHAKAHAKARTYTVRAGDTLSRIAAKLHVHGGWKALYRANRSHLSNPNVIRVGQHLNLP